MDADFVMIKYNHPNIGEHKVVGASTGKNYGYRKGGDQFLVHMNDINLQPHLFVRIQVENPTPAVQAPPPAIQEVSPLPGDLSTMFGGELANLTKMPEATPVPPMPTFQPADLEAPVALTEALEGEKAVALSNEAEHTETPPKSKPRARRKSPSKPKPPVE